MVIIMACLNFDTKGSFTQATFTALSWRTLGQRCLIIMRQSCLIAAPFDPLRFIYTCGLTVKFRMPLSESVLARLGPSKRNFERWNRTCQYI
jgi:hypothetical protein